jgi:hypothetical protein
LKENEPSSPWLKNSNSTVKKETKKEESSEQSNCETHEEKMQTPQKVSISDEKAEQQQEPKDPSPVVGKKNENIKEKHQLKHN